MSSHAEDLGVDPARVAIAGESGGGYICAGTMVLLAREDQSDMVKLAIPIIPMLSDYCFTDQAAMTKYEAEGADGMQKIWRLIAGSEVGRKGGVVILGHHIALILQLGPRPRLKALAQR